MQAGNMKKFCELSVGKLIPMEIRERQIIHTYDTAQNQNLKIFMLERMEQYKQDQE